MRDYQNGTDTWRPFISYCPNCSNKLVGFPDESGMVRIRCRKCMAEVKRKRLGRKHDRLDLYAPEGMTNDFLADEELPFY